MFRKLIRENSTTITNLLTAKQTNKITHTKKPRRRKKERCIAYVYTTLMAYVFYASHLLGVKATGRSFLFVLPFFLCAVACTCFLRLL